MNMLIPIFMLIIYWLTSGAAYVDLSTSSHIIEVNKAVKLNCSSSTFEGQGVWFYWMNESGGLISTFIFFYSNGNCSIFGEVTIPFNFSFHCVNSSFLLEIQNMTMDLHKSFFNCQLFFHSNISNKSKDVVIEVAVPVKNAYIVGVNSSVSRTTIENNATRLTCKTKPSYPAPIVTWYYDLGPSNTKEIDTENITTSQKNEEYHLISVQSNVKLVVSRRFNGTRIYCTARNGFGDEPIVSSSKLQILVQYPPSKPKLLVEATIIGRNITVIMENKLSINCSSNGYPTPSFFWIHKGKCISTKKLLHIPSTNESNNGTYVCIVNNTMEWNHVGKNENEVSVTILVPPSQPIFHFNGSSENVVNFTLYVVKNDSFTVICKSIGVPIPICGWNGTTSGNLTEIFVQEDFKRTCHAASEMVETIGENKSVLVNSTLSVEVLYPPHTLFIQLHNYSEHPQNVTNFVTVEEFSSFNLTCSAVSKPDVNNYTWSGQGQVKSYSRIVILRNISRYENGSLTCHASNVMRRSFGKEQIGQSSKSVSVQVLYASQVTEFFVFGYKEGNPIIAYQRKNATFVCNVDSNPSSAVGLQFKETFLVNETNTRSLIHVIKNVSCSDAGIYYCYSSNSINYGNRSRKQLTLIVKCPPLPINDLKVVNVTTLKYISATLSFKAMDYLDSQNTSFTWQREINASKWETVKDGTAEVKISSFYLQTNLTVINVTEYYSGNYRVLYNNSVGGNTQLFQLSVADIPDQPKYFDYLKDSLTSTQVTVVWTKGYGGGLRQSFVLNISQRSQPIKYDYINETENEDMQHTITGLSSGTQYKLTLWATNKLGRSLSQTLTMLTKEPEDHSNPNLTAPIAGSVSSLVAIVAGVLIAFLLYRRRTVSAKDSDTGKLVYQNVPFEGKKQKKKHLPVNTKSHDVPVTTKIQELPVKKKTQDKRGKIKTQEETSFQVLQEVDDMPPLSNERTEYYNSAEKIAEIENIKVSELLPYVLGRGEESFEAEYQKLPTGLQHPCTFARKPENIALNRYNGIYPYDHSRVKIEGMPDFFINACYINGYTREREYIASLGPTKKVTYDYQSFWLMVWNEHSDIIVMLTNLHEPSGMKCEQYWPECGTTKCYGDIQVSSDREEVFAEYTVRNFIVLNSGEKRSVTHLHYTAWPDKKVPEDVTTLIEFRERLKATASTEKGPVIVHCSAGIGRTGTLIALDRLIKEGQNESSVDVFKCVNSMREQRVKMVQTLEQYIYIYKALVNSLYFDSEMIPIESFREYVDTTNNNIYSKQFQQLKETVEDCIKDKSDTHAESEMLVDKNRRGADIPGRQFRVLVYLNRNTNDSDYINAVYVNSLRIKDHFILAQTPLPNTVTDFVCMMYQENCCCVVTMEDLKEPGMKVGHYLPTDGHSLKFGDITISCTVLETKPQYTVREIRLQNNRQTENREKVAYHFHYTKWMQVNDTPTDAKEFVQFIKDVEDYADQLGEEQSHVLVHCLKANERSALYCIVTILIEKMRYERQVSVLNTVRHLRTRRRTAITSMEQLKFCYQALNAYISLYEQ